MTKTEVKAQMLNELHRLPLEKVDEALDFVLFLQSRVRSEAATTQHSNTLTWMA